METANLSLQLREGTKDSHVRAERSPFMQAFFRGQVPRDGYRELLTRLLPVYEVIEAAQQRLVDDPALKNLYFPELFRVEAIKRDLEFYFGPDWQAHVRDTPAVREYVWRVNWLAENWPAGLAAHHYTRYLGDLSGGQMIKRMVQKSFGLAGDDGVVFYEFPEITDIPAFKDKYRAGMDSIPLADGEAQKIVDEANRAFDLNVGLFSELDELRKAA
jgi:heme oxygenase